MGRWGKIRYLLRALGAIAGSVAVAPVAPVIGVIAGIVATSAVALSIDLPRERWSSKKRSEVAKTPAIISAPVVYNDEEEPAKP